MFIKQISRNDLLKPLQAVVGIVERKQPLPILSNVLLKKNSNGVKFIATDLEIQIESQLTAELQTTTGPDAITISAKKFQDILRAIPDESTVDLDTQENKLLVKANKSRFSLQTLPAQDFPALTEQLTGSISIDIAQGKLKRLLGIGPACDGTTGHPLLPEWCIVGYRWQCHQAHRYRRAPAGVYR